MRFIFIFITLAVTLAACVPSHPIDASITSTAARPSPTTLALEATTNISTLTPSRTPNPTATPTLIPTFALTPNGTYTLQTWAPAQADLLIQQVSIKLAAIDNESDTTSNSGYASSLGRHEYLAFAEREALLRFPNAQQAEKWRWDVCYNLALAHLSPEDTDAPELSCYAKIIEAGLNEGETNISQLATWFREHESRFSFEIKPVNRTASAYSAGYIIRLESNAILWVFEKEGRFTVTGVMSSMFFYRETGVEYQFNDLTGDTYPELILNFGRSYCCGVFSLQFIYDLSLGVPKQLMLHDSYGLKKSIGSEYDNYITPLKDDTSPGFLFKGHFGDPHITACDLLEYDKYYWNDNQFEWVETWYGIDPPDEYTVDKAFCQFAIDTAANPAELNVIVQAIEKQSTEFDKEVNYREIILFRLGEYYAGLANWEKSTEYFARLGDEPTASTSEWNKSAKVFLKSDKTANNFYQLCAKMPQCNIQNALKRHIESIKPESFHHTNEIIKNLGVPIKTSGILDFDQDGTFEQWLVIQHTGYQEPEFWILAKGETKLFALFETGTLLNMFSSFNDNYSFELNGETGKNLYFFKRLEISGQPYIERKGRSWKYNEPDEKLSSARSFSAEIINDAASKIFSGADVAQANKTLLELENSKEYGCATYECDQLYYLIGLSNELLGNQQAATDAYLQLWKNYPKSVYTVMAQSKLKATP